MNGELIHIINTAMMLKYCLKTGEFLVPTEHARYTPCTFHHVCPELESPDVSYWIVRMRNNRKAKNVQLMLDSSDSSDPVMAAFANAMPSGMITWYEERATIWAKEWIYDDENSEWDVSYKEYEEVGLPKKPVVQKDPRTDYRQTLNDIIKLAYAMGDSGPHFAKHYFEEALAYLDGKEANEASIFLLYPQLPEENQRMMCAASAAWVFGTMGSWSDIWVRDEGLSRENVRLSSDLYRDINRMFMYAVNSW